MADAGLEGKKIKYIPKKYYVVVWVGLNWIMIGSSGGLL
jgi:hypothetical protein